MARTAVTISSGTTQYPSAAATLTMAAGDVSNGNYVTATGREVIVLHNTGASTRTYTITSVADPFTGRTGNITTQNITAGAYMAIGPLAPDGWEQTDGRYYIDVSNAEVYIGAYRLA